MSDFQKDLAKSQAALPDAINEFKRQRGGTFRTFSPGCNDRGIDAVWTDPFGASHFVDFKLLSNGRKGDIPLEYEQNGSVGWAVDPDKVTGFFAFYWRRTGQLLIYSAPVLRAAAVDNKAAWCRDYGYFSEHCGTFLAFVPPAALEKAMLPESLAGR